MPKLRRCFQAKGRTDEAWRTGHCPRCGTKIRFFGGDGQKPQEALDDLKKALSDTDLDLEFYRLGEALLESEEEARRVETGDLFPLG